MAKGAISKASATETILKAFPGSFVYDKEIRLPFVEEGEDIQLKCVLTCAKVNVGQGDENAIPGENTSNEINFGGETQEHRATITEEEKQNLKDLMSSLGL